MGWLDGINNIVNSIKKSTRSRFVIDKENNSIQMLLDTKDEQYFTLEFEQMKVESQAFSHFQRAYYIEANSSKINNILVQMIELNGSSSIESSASTMFETYLKDELRQLKLEAVATKELDFAQFTKYQTDCDKEIGTIYLCLNTAEVLIVDVDGKLFHDMLDIYDIQGKSKEKLSISNPYKEKVSFDTNWDVFNIQENVFFQDFD
jgi:hypothetical protein